MLLKLGVDISRLLPPIRKKLNLISSVVLEVSQQEIVVTSTYEGTHSPSSMHYANLAIDIRLPKNYNKVAEELKAALGKGYDVIVESNHIHIEYDPK